MRRLAFAALLVTLGCEQPEDRFVVAGSLVDQFDQPLGGTEVRLLRDLSADGIRCVPMKQVASTVTDGSGAWRFELIRQQLTLGAPRNRVFRVEATDPGGNVSSETFRFPSVDLTLPPLTVADSWLALPWLGNATSATEDVVDGVLAWRGQSSSHEGRDTLSRFVVSQLLVLTNPRDDFGGTEDVDLQTRYETPLFATGPTGEVPQSRSMPCNVGLEGECPLTDGRFTPQRMPEHTRAIEITFTHEIALKAIALRGLITDGEFTVSKVEWGADTTGAWNPYLGVRADVNLQRASQRSCDEPGVFLDLGDLSVAGIRPRQLRLHFIDDEKNTKDILWLAEVSVW